MRICTECTQTVNVFSSIVSGMPSFGGSYQKTLFATLERQLVASLEVSGWGIRLCDM